MHANLTNLLAPPFPPLSSTDLTDALCTLTQHETSPGLENETTMALTNGQASSNGVNHYHANPPFLRESKYPTLK